MAMILRDMTLRDVPQVARIEASVIPEAWSEQAIAQTLSREDAVCRVCCEDDRVIGYYTYFAIVDEADINNIAVAPDRHRQGIGSMLVADLIQTMHARGLQSAILEVRASNAAAIALYTKFGFVQVGCRKKYYSNTEDALLLRLQ